ncbi:MAG: CidA/LrgA family protein [Polyangiaceae bacterium]|nr:CidA/LrgA family protein [Polyangiaceae bacterium]
MLSAPGDRGPEPARLLGFAWILFFSAGGELVARAASSPVPGSVLGLLAFVAALRAGIVRRERVAWAARALTSTMGLFFVPAAVLATADTAAARAAWAPIVAASLVSLALVMLVVGKLAEPRA